MSKIHNINHKSICMKKFLLLSALIAGTVPSFAIVENDTYEAYDGIECKNLYNFSLNYSKDEFAETPMAEFNNRTRSMVARDGKLYIGESRTMVVGEESTDVAHLIIIDQATGKIENRLQLTHNGNPITGLLCANQIGVDDFGNLWMIGLVGDSGTKPWTVYHIKDVVTGECDIVAELKVPDEEAEVFGRHDYYDLVGDVTGTQAGTVVMSPVANGTNTFVVGFEREQGSDVWGPHMEDYYSNYMSETYPADQATWNGAPMIRIIRDEEYSANLFYIDAFVTCPALYNVEGTLLDSFAFAQDLAPAIGPNGVMEFSFLDRDFMAYTLYDYDQPPLGSQVRVVELGPDQAFEGMKLAWDLPKGGLGETSDSGTRMMGICPSLLTDKNGKRGCMLSIFKCANGLTTYLLSEPGFEAGVNEIENDMDNSDAPVEYFDIQGRRLNDTVPGQLVIKKQGTAVSKMLVK